MPNFTKLFQEEVRRLARKELKGAFARAQKGGVELKRALAGVKKRLSAIERNQKQLMRQAGADTASTTGEPEGASPRLRISSTTIRTLRDRLRLTQTEFAKLVGVSGQSVYQWERRGGRLHLRHATLERIREIKSLGAREARKRLTAPRKR